MAVDMFLKVPGAPGESSDKTHKGEIDVLAWSWGVSSSGSFHVGGGGGAGKANFQDLSITKFVDKSSPVFGLFCANGKHFENATLTVRKAGEKPLEYIKIDMKKVLVTSVSTGGSGGEDRLTENISLNFAEVEFAYKEQKEDGSGQAPTGWMWDIRGNHGSST